VAKCVGTIVTASGIGLDYKVAKGHFCEWWCQDFGASQQVITAPLPPSTT